MKTRHVLGSTFFLVGLVINPAYFLGCSAECDDVEHDYGAQEMRGLLNELNERRSWDFVSDEGAFTVELSLMDTGGPTAQELGTPAQAAHSCALQAHAFSATAVACDVQVEMDMLIEGTLTVFTDDGSESTLVDEVAVTGRLAVGSHRFKDAPTIVTLRNEAFYLLLEGETSGDFHLATLESDGVELVGRVNDGT